VPGILVVIMSFERQYSEKLWDLRIEHNEIDRVDKL